MCAVALRTIVRRSTAERLGSISLSASETRIASSSGISLRRVWISSLSISGQ